MMAQKDRLPLANLSNSENNLPSRRRARDDGIADAEKPLEPLVEVQRFSLVSRGAPPVARKRARYSNLLAPPGLAAQLGDRISVCRCSECPGDGGQRLCRRDTELHGEYALLLNMVSNFDAECPNRMTSGSLVTDACCREKSAFFILGPGRRTVGYAAAIVAANKKVIRQITEESSVSQVPGQTKQSKADRKAAEAPHILQIYVEPEFRRQGLATAALELLLRDHDTLMVDEPTWPVIKMLESLDYTTAGESDGPDGRPVVRFVQTHEEK